MTGHRLEVADIFHAHQNQFLQRWGHVVSDQQRKALRDIGRCRTAALGTHLDRCNYETVAYDSCRNRHCPKCQSSARDRWLMQQAASLLPVPYAHVVFTVPEQLAPLALRNQRLFYNLLFRAASETLLEIAADPRHLGARIGALAVLHTWSQNLGHHPHLTALYTAQQGVGGLLQASVRRPRTCPEVSRPLHPPRRHLQRKAAQPRQRTGALSLERLQA
jgi:hypothetical protein